MRLCSKLDVTSFFLLSNGRTIFSYFNSHLRKHCSCWKPTHSNRFTKKNPVRGKLISSDLPCSLDSAVVLLVPEERGYIKRILYHDFRIILFYNIWIDNVSFYLFLQEENVKSSGRESLRGNLGISTTIYFKMTN